MQPVKRIEIIASSKELPKLLKALDRAEVSGYSVINNVIGKGPWGNVSSDFDIASSPLSNVYILSYCVPETIDTVIEYVLPVLHKYGGVCYVSESLEVTSVKCVAR